MAKNFDELWDYSNPSKTRVKFEKFLSQNFTSAKVSDDLLQLKSQIARTYSLEHDFDNAHKILDDIQKNLNIANTLTKIRYELERGRTFNSAQILDKAQAHFSEALNLCQGQNFDFYATDAIHMLAICISSLEEKELLVNRGIKIAKDSSDLRVKKWVGVFYNNLGWDHFEAENYDEALELFKKCEEFYRQSENKVAQNIARWSMAKTYRFMGLFAKALKIQEKLLSENGGHDESGYSYEELAELYFQKGNYAVAKNYFKRAYDILSQDKWLVENEPERIERLLKNS